MEQRISVLQETILTETVRQRYMYRIQSDLYWRIKFNRVPDFLLRITLQIIVSQHRLMAMVVQYVVLSVMEEEPVLSVMEQELKKILIQENTQNAAVLMGSVKCAGEQAHGNK